MKYIILIAIYIIASISENKISVKI